MKEFRKPYLQAIRRLTCYGFAPSKIVHAESPMAPVLHHVLRLIHRLPNIETLHFVDILSCSTLDRVNTRYIVDPNWADFTSVTTLSLCRVTLLHMMELVGVVSGFPNMVALELDRVHWHGPNTNAQSPHFIRSRPPALERLRLTRLEDNVLDQLAFWYELHPDVAKSLTTIDVDVPSELGAMRTVLRVLGDNITYLKIRLSTSSCECNPPPGPLCFPASCSEQTLPSFIRRVDSRPFHAKSRGHRPFTGSHHLALSHVYTPSRYNSRFDPLLSGNSPLGRCGFTRFAPNPGQY